MSNDVTCPRCGVVYADKDHNHRCAPEDVADLIDEHIEQLEARVAELEEDVEDLREEFERKLDSLSSRIGRDR
jgi:uncharacterized protein YceH (UPF0502 family)